ncbi:MAG: carbohydrate binding domain-containing protein, partial [Acutalibacteraceae bacterium]
VKLIQNIDSDCALPGGSSTIYFGEMTMKEIPAEAEEIAIPNSSFASATEAFCPYYSAQPNNDIANAKLKLDPNGYNGSKSPMLTKADFGMFRLQANTVIAVEPNHTYEFSFMAKFRGNEGDARYYVTVQQYANSDGSGAFTGYDWPNDAKCNENHDWRRVTGTFTTKADTHSVILSVDLDDYPENGQDTFDQEEAVYLSLDDFCLTDPSVPAVEDIVLALEKVVSGREYTLAASVLPGTLENAAVEWAVKDAAGTGAEIENNTLKTVNSGKFTITAVVRNGGLYGDFVKEFTLTSFEPGDVNGDGSINICDLIRIKKLAAADQQGNTLADINGDGVLNSSDLTALRRQLLDM